MSLLNTGQQLVIASALVAMLWRATQGVVDGRLTLGDLVMINAFMIQLYIPLNFLGVLYREIKQSLTDLDKMFTLLERHREVDDHPDARPLQVSQGVVRFDHVGFAYEPARPILHDLSFEIPAGKTLAVVGPSGAGKSTLARLLYRFYDVGAGRITIDGQDIRQVTQASLRAAIGIVPQDTVLFNDTIEYNIAYGRTGASRAEVEAAARAAHIHEFIASTPQGYDAIVGERGLKLSGGEKQRVAIARTLLKNPPILIFDEATSALDSANERAIQAELRSAAQGKTALVIAHRLSTVVDAHEIVVLEQGRVVERGAHAELLARGGRYARDVAAAAKRRQFGMTTSTLSLTRPDDWHLHLRDGDALRAVLPHTARQFARAIVMPNLKPPVTTTALALDYRRRILDALPEARRGLRAADDAVPDRPHAAGRDAPRARGRHRRAEAVPGRRHDEQRCRRHRHPQDLRHAGGDAARRPAAAGAWRGHRCRHRPVRPRGGVHRPRAAAAAARLSRPEDRLRAHHHARGGAVRGRGRRPPGGDDHRAPPAVQPQRHLPGRLAAALLLPAGAQARGASRWRWWPPPRPARRSSFSAPTARRMPRC